MKDQGSVIYWFRKGLRLHDNPALVNALMLASASGKTLRCVYIFDPWHKENKQISAHKYRFIIQSLHDLHQSLYELGSRLFVFRGKPEEIFKTYFKKWGTLFITWEKEVEPYSVKRDEEIKLLAESIGIGVSTHDSNTLYETEGLIAQNEGKVPSNFKKFSALLKCIDLPTRPVTTPTVIPDACKIATDETISWECDIPTLRDLAGIDDEALGETIFPGGEHEGRERLEKEISTKHKPSNFLEPSPTELTPYVTFGCVSPREVYWKIKDKYKDAKPSKLPSIFHFLTWREYYYCLASVTSNFNKIDGNPICRQIPWDNDIEKFIAWCDGKTGFPFIDAVMTQLKTEGWIHYQLRNVVGCFLTRGDLWQSWEEGCSIFEEFLLDADLIVNAANWLRVSMSAFAYQYFRVYSPVMFGQKSDPDGEYIKKYIPRLEKFPPKYIYNPWDAPLDIQKKAGCFIGVDYPEPIVEHSIVLKENLQKMKQVFANIKLSVKRKIENESGDEDSGSDTF